MKQLYHKILEYSYSGRAGWLNEFAWHKIPVKQLKYIRFTPPETIPQ